MNREIWSKCYLEKGRTGLDNHVPQKIGRPEIHGTSINVGAIKDITATLDINTLCLTNSVGLTADLLLTPQEARVIAGQNKDKIISDQYDTPENVDLLNFATIETMTKKGQVFILPHQQMPAASEAVAILRY